MSNQTISLPTAVDKRIPLLHDDLDFEHLALVEPKLNLIPRR